MKSARFVRSVVLLVVLTLVSGAAPASCQLSLGLSGVLPSRSFQTLYLQSVVRRCTSLLTGQRRIHQPRFLAYFLFSA